MKAVGRDLRGILFALFAVLALFYSLISLEYFIDFNDKPLTLWETVFAQMTSNDFAQEGGSIRTEMHTIYLANRMALQLHATTGAVMLFLGIFQFWTPLRERYPAIHRKLGLTYVLLAIPTSLGALVYLASVPPNQIFSGRVFMFALLGLALGTGLSTYMAYRTARQRRFEAHRAWMLQSYFYILSAPVLRVLWTVIYQINDGMDQWHNNLYAVGPAAAIIAFGPLIFLGMKTPGAAYANRTN